MASQIILMRHGQIVQATPRRFVGQRDIPLDAEGRSQAEAVGRHLADVPLVRVVASNLGRTMETAAIVCRGQGRDRGLVVEPEPALREIRLGAWEGLTVDEVRQQFPGEYEKRGLDMAGYRPKGGESFLDVGERAWPALERAASTDRSEDRGGDGVVLVVAHAGVNRMLVCRILGLDPANLFRMDQDYCGLNGITRKKGQFVLEYLNARPWMAASPPGTPRTG